MIISEVLGDGECYVMYGDGVAKSERARLHCNAEYDTMYSSPIRAGGVNNVAIRDVLEDVGCGLFPASSWSCGSTP